MEMYDRQIRAFGIAGQKILQGLHVGIVGAGGIGSLICVLLTRLGVGRITLLDPDVVEVTNLNRLAGATWKDAEEGAAKVETLARYAESINRDVQVIPVQGSVLEEATQEYLKGCDVLFGCTDNQSSRWVLNQLANKHLIPYFDTGTGIKVGSDQRIEHAGGQVRVVIPGLGCLQCIGGLKMDIVQQELLPEPDRNVALQLGYIDGAEIKAPAVASLNGVIANLAVTEFMAFVTGLRPVQRFIAYDFMNATVLPYTFPKDPDCFACSPLGSLAIGDEGAPFPGELLVDPSSSKDQGETPMENEMKSVQEAIAELLDHAEQNGVPIEGDPDSQWFLMQRVTLGDVFSRPTSSIMVKFFGDNIDPVILIPARVEMDSNAQICPYFMAARPCLKGWKALCPHMFQDVGGDLLPFVACLCGFLANPSLCGCMGCPAREADDDQS